MKNLINYIQNILTPYEKKKFALIALLCICSAILSFLSIVSLMPFLYTAADPGQIETRPALRTLYNLFNFNSNREFLIFTGTLTFVVILLSNASNIILSWAMNRFSVLRTYTLSNKVFKSLIASHYDYFLNNDIGQLKSIIISQAEETTDKTFTSLFNVIRESFNLIFIAAILVYTKPEIALMLIGIFGVIYFFLYIFLKKKIEVLANRLAETRRKLLYHVTSPFTGIKEVKLKNAENYFSEKYKDSTHILAKDKSIFKAFQQIPGYMIETIAYGAMVLLCVVFIKNQQDFTNAIPTIAIYAFATHRLLPSLRILFVAITDIKNNLPNLSLIHDHIHKFCQEELEKTNNIQIDKKTPQFNNCIEFKNICFTYNKSESMIFDQLNLSIKKNEKIGILGKSGTGKTTFTDLLTGLLIPTSGEIFVDGISLQEFNINEWRKSIGYVTQESFILEDSIAKNIAFGVAEEDIDRERIHECIRLASLNELISALPNGIDTLMGPTGTSFSGGQKQRLSIARTLYFDADLIIFDEPTSSLDGVTEKAFEENIRNLSEHKTILIITHKVESTKDCDRIFYLGDSQNFSIGNYQDLIEGNPDFARFTKRESFSKDSHTSL